jgi:hypothetical protein
MAFPLSFNTSTVQLVAQTSMFLNSNSAGQNSEINDMPMLVTIPVPG